MSKTFDRFQDTLNKLDADTITNTKGITRMARTFEDSDRHLKHLMQVQSRRFVTVFIVATIVSVIAVAGLVTAVFVLLKQM